MTLADGLEQQQELQELRAELARLNRRLAREHDQKIRLEETVSVAAKAAFSSWPAPRIPKPRVRARRKDPETVVAMCSDWHYGSVTPDFNPEVCERRVRDYAEKIIQLAGIQRADHPVKEFRLWLLGDLVTGEAMFPSQAWEIDSSAVEQAFGVGRIISDLALTLLPHFERGTIVGVPGNHSIGSTHKSPYSPDTRLDTVAYLAAKERLAKVDRISWRIARAQDGDSGRILVDRVGDYGTLLTHGDLFRGSGGMAQIPFYAMTVKPLRWRDMMIAGEIPPFTDLAAGHWHKTTRYPIGSMVLRIGGTLQTYDPYSREQIAAATLPQQTLLFVHPERGVTAEYVVDLP